MINKFSLPIFDFNLQWVALFTLPSLPTADCLLVPRDRFDRQPQCYGKISKLIKTTFYFISFFAFVVVVVLAVVSSVGLRVEATLVFISVPQLTEVYFQSTFQLFSAFFSICFPCQVHCKFVFGISLCYRMQCEVGRGNPWDINTIFTFEQKVTFPNNNNNNKCRYKVQEIVHEIWKRMRCAAKLFIYAQRSQACQSSKFPVPVQHMRCDWDGG